MELTREHINYNLGISVPLNEYIILSKEIKLIILNEQILYETFLGSIKDFAKDKLDKIITTIKDWKDAAAILGKILSDSDLLNDFLNPLERRVLGLIKLLIDFLKKIKLDSFIEPITEFINKIKSLQGWKKFMALVSIGSIITYILEKVKSLAPEAIKDFLKKQFTGDFVDTILDKLTDFKSYLGWLEPIVKGVEVIFNFLKPLIQTFSTALTSGSKWATKLVKENTIKNENIMKNSFQQLAGITENNLTQFNMKERFQQLAGIKEVTTDTSSTQVQGQIKTDLFKKLNVADFDPAKFSTTIALVKQGKSLNVAANKVLADIMVAMIKTSDDNLLNQIFVNLKQIEAK